MIWDRNVRGPTRAAPLFGLRAPQLRAPGGSATTSAARSEKARRDDRRADIRKEASVIERYNLIVIERGKIL